MTALEKLAINLNPADAYVSDEFLDTFRWKCPDEVFPDAIPQCTNCDDKSFALCVKCWLQEVSECD